MVFTHFHILSQWFDKFSDCISYLSKCWSVTGTLRPARQHQSITIIINNDELMQHKIECLHFLRAGSIVRTL